jgi:superfamily II DNA helicase RecQ
VIFSPLLALMRNQVEAADRAGIRARTINSANLHERQEIEAQIAEGFVDVLLISPERLTRSAGSRPGFSRSPVVNGGEQGEKPRIARLANGQAGDARCSGAQRS